MTGKDLDDIFGQQKPPEIMAFTSINALNYKLTDVVMLVERLLPEGAKKENVFKKLVELKATIDCAAIHNPEN
jgi:hypothetical protein